jgi:NAD(P)-dependent dehydrogenase (short-subunit alcohol dehydrogenase family)
MRTFVFFGGTDGMGKAAALHYLGAGDQVAVVGRNAAKGAAFLDTAATLGAGDRAHFIRADLSLVAETRAAIDQLRAIFSKVDAIVLGARHYRSTRLETAEGFEYNFALHYLTRFVLSYGMIDLLDAAEQPVILNLGGEPGSGTGDIRWDDLQFERDYHGMSALVQSGQLTDLLGIAFAQNRPSPKVRYVLLHPGVVNTNFSGEYDEQTAAQIVSMRATAAPIEKAILSILDVLDHPPVEPLTAVSTGHRVDVTTADFDAEAAKRLHTDTVTLLSRLTPAALGV